MTSIAKKMYFDKLDDIVNKYNNTYHSEIKMKPVNIKWNPYINYGKEINNKDPKFKIDDIVKISKYKIIFAKGYIPNWSAEVFVIKKVKITVPWANAISDFNGEEAALTLYKKELQKTNQEEFRVKKVSWKSYENGDILYVKWKEYGNSFYSWIYRKT